MRIQEHVSLSELTTFHIGGNARYFVSVETQDELREAIHFAAEKDIPFVIFGGGSNMLVSDEGFPGLVLQIGIKGLEWQDDGATVLLIAGAGEKWDALVGFVVARGLWGVENLSGIPGSVGATPVQNIGAYGAEIREVLQWVEVFDPKTGAISKMQNAECCFGYRDSIFKHPEGKRLIILRVAYRMKKEGKPNLSYIDVQQFFIFQFSSSIFTLEGTIFNEDEKKQKLETLTPQDIRRTVLAIRSKNFPDLNVMGKAGSFFKNPIIPLAHFEELKKKYPELPGFPVDSSSPPARGGVPSRRGGGVGGGRNKRDGCVKISLAWILDHLCHMRGVVKGPTALFERQPIVLVNTGGAKAEEVEALAREVADCVRKKTGIEVEWEVAFF